MYRTPAPDLKYLKLLYRYNPETGLFRHKRNTGRGRIGRIAGLQRDDGYISVSIDGLAYLAHHLAWYYVYGTWPQEVDHWDRNRSNNRIKNLRDATRGQNNMNSDGWSQDKRTHKLPRGVYHYPQCPGRYRSQIVVNKKPIHLGCFNSIAEAEQTYKAAAHKHFGEFAS